jgi:hypothetical protein
MKTKLKNLRSLLCLALLASSISACTYVSPEKKAEFVTARISSALDFSKEQKAKANEIKDMYLTARGKYAGERKEQFEKVKQAIGSEKLEAVTFKNMISQRQKMMDENFDPIFGKVAELHSTFTPEQKKSALELMDKYSKYWE